MRAQSTSLNYLPANVLRKIFNICLPKDLLSLTQTCKRFNNIITLTPHLIDNFEVRLDQKNVGKEWIGLRGYSRIYICGFAAHHYVDIIDRMVNHVTHLRCDVFRVKISVLKSIFMKLKNLKVVDISKFDNEINDSEPGDFEELPTLSLDQLKYYGDVKVFQIFQKCQVKELLMDQLDHQEGFVNLDYFRGMLRAQKSLKSLTLNNFNEESGLFAKPIGKIEFKLKNLTLKFFECWKNKNFRNFIDSQKDSLEFLDINYNGEMLEYFQGFTKLNKVKIKSCDLSNIELKTVKTLHIKEVSPNFHECFPNVETLWISGNLQDYSILKQFRALRVLIFDDCQVPTLDTPSVRKIVFTNTTFTNERPFTYDFMANDSKINQIMIIKSDASWLIRFLEIEKNRLIHLCLEECKISWKLKYALEKHENKINELEIVDSAYLKKSSK